MTDSQFNLTKLRVHRDPRHLDWEKLVQTYAQGTIHGGTVTRFLDSGALVDLGGVNSHLSWGTMDRSQVAIGQVVSVRVESIEIEKRTMEVSLVLPLREDK